MSRQSFLDASPPLYTGSREVLDKSLFRKSLNVLAARVPAVKTNQAIRSDALKKSIIDLPRIRSVVADPASTGAVRLVLLNVADEAQLPPAPLEYLKTISSGFAHHTLDLDYGYWTAEQILHSFLPEELREGAPVGFSIVGHIAHVNLNDEYLPYKHIIGQVILDKNPTIDTVVNKLNTINNVYRFFQMELIAGEPDYIVEHHESDCRFTFDFSQVYWNSRLHQEHDRLVQVFAPQDLVVDVFAGVGPFAVPAAKKGCAVMANDLNPQSARYLGQNVRDNRVTENCRVFCEDGRNFIRESVIRAFEEPFPGYTGPKPSRTKERLDRKKPVVTEISAPTAPPRSAVNHFVMNLPDSAIQFLDAFRGVLAPVDGQDLREVYSTTPLIHCHCFTRELERPAAEADIRQRVEEKLGWPIQDDVNIHLVRSVAPGKDMYCISFRLPSEVAYKTVS